MGWRGVSQLRASPAASSEGQPQRKTNSAATINVLLTEAVEEPAKIRFAINAVRVDLDLLRRWIDADVEAAQVADFGGGIEVGRDKRVIEDVVELRAESQLRLLAKSEGLVDPQVRSPGSRPSEQIAPGDFGIVEHIRTHRR